MWPSSADRVPENTAQSVADFIERQTKANLLFYSQSDDETIRRRLSELDREWDVERALETQFGLTAALAVVLGALTNRKWYALSFITGAFMAQHALQGWCPPVEMYRRLGYRTRKEIDQERFALKAVRGDFREIPENRDQIRPERLLEVMRR
jgi:hypothetical protein